MKRVHAKAVISLAMATGLFALTANGPLSAQQGGRYNNSVIINTDVLNSLGASPSVAPLPYRPNYVQGATSTYAGSSYLPAPGTTAQSYGGVVSRPGNLLFPPPRNPRSQLTGTNALAGTFGGGYAAPASPALPQIGSSANVAPSAQPKSQLLIPVTQTAITPTTAQPSVPQVAASTANAPATSSQAVVAVPSVPAVPETTIPTIPAAPAAPDPVPAAAPVTEVEAVAVAQPSVTSQSQESAAEEVETVVAVPAVPATTETVATTVAPPPPPEPETVPTVVANASSEATSQESASTASETAESDSNQTAALPSNGGAGEGILSIGFAEGESELSAQAEEQLKGLAGQLRSNESMRIQLLAYASGDAENTRLARHLSLSRALKVRSFLIEEGIPSVRMQVRALGNQAESDPPDRVDIKPQGG